MPPSIVACLNSETHREKAGETYERIEASFLKELQTESLRGTKDRQARFLLETGSLKTYRAIVEKTADPEFFRRGNQLYYLLGERTLNGDFSRLRRYNQELATFPGEVLAAPAEALRFDPLRRYFIFNP